MRSFLDLVDAGTAATYYAPDAHSKPSTTAGRNGLEIIHRKSVYCYCNAGVAELADAQDLGSCGRKVVGVQIPPPAPSL